MHAHVATTEGAVLPTAEKVHSDLLFFDKLVELVPARFYFPKEEVDNWKPRHGKSATAAAKQEAKEQRQKAKRQKLDPTNFASTVDIQKQRAAEEAAAKAEGNGAGESSEGKEPQANKGGSSASYAELQARLHSRIEHLRGKRPTDTSESKKRTKTKGPEPQVRNKKSKVKAPEGAKEQKEDQKAKKEQPKARSSKKEQEKKHGTDELNLNYSKLEVDPEMEKAKAKRHEKKLSRTKKKHKLLEEAEALAKAAGEDDPEKKEMVQKHAWKAALGRAAGEKVLDDPKLLKKSIKREASVKKKSAKKWKERHKRAQSEVKAKQEKRKTNIETRVQAKKDRKIAKREKKLMNPGRKKT